MAQPGKLTVTPDSREPIAAGGGSRSISVAIDPADGSWAVSDVHWVPATAPDWLHGFTVGAVQTGSSTLSLTADANDTNKPRSAVITLLSSDGKSKKSVTVNQAK
jgi:hypothetical protein